MIPLISIIVLLGFSGCGDNGPTLNVKGKVDPVEVKTVSRIYLDVENLEQYYRAACMQEHNLEEEISLCTRASLANFLDLFTSKE